MNMTVPIAAEPTTIPTFSINFAINNMIPNALSKTVNNIRPAEVYTTKISLLNHSKAKL
jgi:hypothetical protein